MRGQKSTVSTPSLSTTPGRKKYFGCVFDAVLRINNENTPTGLTVGMDMVVEGYKDWEQEPCALWGIRHCAKLMDTWLMEKFDGSA